jgi:hypothetical protein
MRANRQDKKEKQMKSHLKIREIKPWAAVYDFTSKDNSVPHKKTSISIKHV